LLDETSLSIHELFDLTRNPLPADLRVVVEAKIAATLSSISYQPDGDETISFHPDLLRGGIAASAPTTYTTAPRQLVSCTFVASMPNRRNIASVFAAGCEDMSNATERISLMPRVRLRELPGGELIGAVADV
jgi:hypothetical protein